MLIRSEAKGGLPTYEAADIAYLRNKLERGFDRAIYVLGADHIGLAKWFQAIAQDARLRPGARSRCSSTSSSI